MLNGKCLLTESNACGQDSASSLSGSDYLLQESLRVDGCVGGRDLAHEDLSVTACVCEEKHIFGNSAENPFHTPLRFNRELLVFIFLCGCVACSWQILSANGRIVRRTCLLDALCFP